MLRSCGSLLPALHQTSRCFLGPSILKPSDSYQRSQLMREKLPGPEHPYLSASPKLPGGLVAEAGEIYGNFLAMYLKVQGGQEKPGETCGAATGWNGCESTDERHTGNAHEFRICGNNGGTDCPCIILLV